MQKLTLSLFIMTFYLVNVNGGQCLPLSSVFGAVGFGHHTIHHKCSQITSLGGCVYLAVYVVLLGQIHN